MGVFYLNKIIIFLNIFLFTTTNRPQATRVRSSSSSSSNDG